MLDDIVDKYNNTGQRTIQMKPTDIISGSYAEYNEDCNITKPKLKVPGHVNNIKIQKHFCQRIHPKLVRRSFYC